MSDVTIKIFDNGPLRVEGKINVLDGAGNEIDLGEKDAVALCRCGRSGNAPFCDGTHGREGFVSEVRTGKES